MEMTQELLATLTSNFYNGSFTYVFDGTIGSTHTLQITAYDADWYMGWIGSVYH